MPTCRTPLAKGTCRWRRGNGTKESFSLLLAGLAPSQKGAGQQTGAHGAEQPVSTAHSTELELARWHDVCAGEREDSEGRKGGTDDEKSPRNLAELNAVSAEGTDSGAFGPWYSDTGCTPKSKVWCLRGHSHMGLTH